MPKDVESDNSEKSDDEKLIEEGNPLEDEEEVVTEIVTGDFCWTKVRGQMNFPWLKPMSHNANSGMKNIKKSQFHRMNPFQILLKFVPMEWFEDVTAETNR